MLLLLVCGANAQVLPELEGKTATIGVAVANFQANTWYFLHQSRPNSADAHSVVGELPTAGGFAYEKGEGARCYKSSIADVPDESNTEVAAPYMVRFLESDNQEGAYIIQFGTGRYLDGDLNACANRYDAVDMNIYTINTADGPQEGHFALNKWDKGSILDNNSVGGTLAWWGSGEVTSINGNNDWAIHEVVIAELDVRTAALQKTFAITNKYNELSQNFEGGTEPGQYDPTALATLKAALDKGFALDGPEGESASVDDINAIGVEIEEAYNACVATRVYYTTPNGYYRIVSALEFTETIVTPAPEEGGEETSEEIHPIKAMYATETAAKWATLEPENCTYLWKLEGTPDHNFKIMNAATDGGFNAATATSASFTMADTATVMRLEVLERTEDGQTVLAIIRADQTDAYRHLHAGGHGGGAGKNGDIVAWTTEGSPASRWLLQAVSEEEANAIIEAYAPIKDHEALVLKYTEMKNDAKTKLEAAKDIFTNLFEDEALITEASQFSSPFTTTDAQQKDGAEATEEDVYGFLLDGNAGTYWHSAWESGSVAGGTHYIQVELPAGKESIQSAAIRFTRRNVANDHITEWGIYGTNEAEAEKEACTELATISTPWASNTETITSGVFPVGGYKYIRFYINNTVGSAISATRGYGHMSEFQMFPAEVSQRTPNQYTVMGAIATNLEGVLTAQAELEPADVSIEEYNTLKAAYDAFIAKYTDPAPLRAKIAEVKDIASTIKTGNNPGEWSSTSAGATLTTTIAQATAYDEAADYTPAQSEKWIADLTAAAEAVPAAANQIKTGKWYSFRFGTEAEYEANGWSKTGAEAHESEEGKVDPELFGKYLSVAKVQTIDEESGAYEIIGSVAADVCLGNQLYFQDKEMEIEEKDLAMWRFISVADTAYIIQNKGTGLFMKAAGESGAVSLSVHPSLFAAPKAIGYGQTITTARTLDGANCNNLHAQRDYNVLVTWGAATPGSNSGLYIEEVGDVAADYAGTTFQTEALEGEFATYCYPVSVTCTGTNAKIYAATLNGTEVTLNPLTDNTAKAGQPFVLVVGDREAYNPEATAEDYKPVSFTHEYDLVKEAGTLASLTGTFSSEKIGAGKIVAEGNTFTISKKSATTIGANSAYITPEEEIDPATELTVIMSDQPLDGVSSYEAAAKVLFGAIYTIDGKCVGYGDINTVKALGAGTYILNGVKMIVK